MYHNTKKTILRQITLVKKTYKLKVSDCEPSTGMPVRIVHFRKMSSVALTFEPMSLKMSSASRGSGNK